MREEVLHLEWVYYRALERAERPPRLLEERLASDPDFLVMLMTHLYRPAGEVAAEDEADGEKAAGGKVASESENIVISGLFGRLVEKSLPIRVKRRCGERLALQKLATGSMLRLVQIFFEQVAEAMPLARLNVES